MAAGALCSRYSRTNCVRSLNLVYPEDLVRRVFRLSATGSYVTVEITATRITCSGPADTHSFSPTFPGSAIVSICLFALRLKLNHFHPIGLKTLFKSFVSSCLFSLFIVSSFHCTLFFYFRHFGCIPKFPALSLHLCLSLSCPLSVIVHSICSRHRSLLYPPLFPSGLQLRYYKCYCRLALGQISKAINQYSKKIM